MAVLVSVAGNGYIGAGSSSPSRGRRVHCLCRYEDEQLEVEELNFGQTGDASGGFWRGGVGDQALAWVKVTAITTMNWRS